MLSQPKDCRTTGELVTLFCDTWNRTVREKAAGQFREIAWINQSDGGPHEANFLKLDCSLIRMKLGWRPAMHVGEAVNRTVEWTKSREAGEDMIAVTDRQIREYFGVNK